MVPGELFLFKKITYLTTARTSRNQKGPGLSGKLQITNYKQSGLNRFVILEIRQL
jgi:hypothetical protein